MLLLLLLYIDMRLGELREGILGFSRVIHHQVLLLGELRQLLMIGG